MKKGDKLYCYKIEDDSYYIKNISIGKNIYYH